MYSSIARVFSAGILSHLTLGVASILLIRYLAPQEYATYTLAMGFVGVVGSTLSSSFNRIYVVGNERFSLKRRFSEFVGLQSVLVLVSGVFILPWSAALDGTFVLVLLLILSHSFSNFAKTYYQESNRFRRYSLVEVSRSAAYLLFIAAVIWWSRQDATADVVLAAKAASLGLVAVIVLWNKLEWRNLLNLREAAKIALPIVKGPYRHLFAYFAVLAAFGQIDVFMLTGLASDYTLAAYGSAFRYYTLLLMALGSVGAVLLPAVQQSRSREDIDALYRKHSRVVAVFVPIVLIGIWLCQWLIPMIDGGKYPEAVGVFRILSISAVVSLSFSPHVNLIMKAEDFKYLVYSISAASIVNLSMNAVLIPRFGAVGAAVTTLCAFGLFNTAVYVRARTHRANLDSSLHSSEAIEQSS